MKKGFPPLKRSTLPNNFSSAKRKAKKSTKRSGSGKIRSLIFGRNDRIRTCDILVPNQARYQLRYIPICIYYSRFPSTCQDFVRIP